MDANYRILEETGVISRTRTTAKLVRLISCHGREPKIDIRTWMGEQMLKGVTLTKDEAKTLPGILQGMDL